MTALYNEIEAYAAQWMRNLVAADHVAAGIVDERSIVDLRRGDVADHCQVHFFAGIAGWSAALRMAGWPDDVPVWTGSCPCQPFSSAGGRKGFDDPRHLWPTWFGLIKECRPPVVFGEQVASPDGLAWLDAVRRDLEDAGYAFAAFDLSAAGVGAPHIRQRLYFVALADGERLERVRVQLRERGPFAPLFEAGRGSSLGELANNTSDGCEEWSGLQAGRGSGPCDHSVTVGLGDAGVDGDLKHVGELPSDEGQHDDGATDGDYASVAAGATRGFWSDCEWVYCTDDTYRPVEPGTFPLADGVPARVGRLRAYGNAIAIPLAATFIRAVMEILCATSARAA